MPQPLQRDDEMETYITVLSSTSEIREAPAYIKVLPCGYVSSEKGDFIVDADSFHLMKAYMEHRNIDVVIDYEHQTLNDVQAPAGGWIKELVLKSDGVYAKVAWTERARKYLINREYRYLSPVVQVRKRDRKAVQLHSVALTNTPAINGMTPIINSMSLAEDKPDQDVMQKHILKMLNLSEDDFRKYGSGEGNI